MDTSEISNTSLEDSGDGKKRKKRSMVERELETNLTSLFTSPLASDSTTSSRSRYGRALKKQNEIDLDNDAKSKTQKETNEVSSAKSTPTKIPIEERIDMLYKQNLSLSRFKDNGGDGSDKTYIQKDLIQHETQESPSKKSSHLNNILERSSDKYSLSKNYDIPSVVLEFSSNKSTELDKKELEALEQASEYQINDMAWARFGSYPFWPCIVSLEPYTDVFVKKKVAGKGDTLIVHVIFFGDNGRRGWVSSNMLRKYEGLQEFENAQAALKPELKKKDPKLYAAFIITEKRHPKWKLSVDEAEYIYKQPKVQRFECLNDMLMKDRALKVTPSKKELAKISRKSSDVSLSESLYDTLFSEDDIRTDDSDNNGKKHKQPPLDVSEVVTACLDDMAAKTGLTNIKKESHMDRWLLKAKSKTPEKRNRISISKERSSEKKIVKQKKTSNKNSDTVSDVASSNTETSSSKEENYSFFKNKVKIPKKIRREFSQLMTDSLSSENDLIQSILIGEISNDSLDIITATDLHTTPSTEDENVKSKHRPLRAKFSVKKVRKKTDSAENTSINDSTGTDISFLESPISKKFKRTKITKSTPLRRKKRLSKIHSNSTSDENVHNSTIESITDHQINKSDESKSEKEIKTEVPNIQNNDFIEVIVESERLEESLSTTVKKRLMENTVKEAEKVPRRVSKRGLSLKDMISNEIQKIDNHVNIIQNSVHKTNDIEDQLFNAKIDAKDATEISKNTKIRKNGPRRSSRRYKDHAEISDANGEEGVIESNVPINKDRGNDINIETKSVDNNVNTIQNNILKTNDIEDQSFKAKIDSKDAAEISKSTKIRQNSSRRSSRRYKDHAEVSDANKEVEVIDSNISVNKDSGDDINIGTKPIEKKKETLELNAPGRRSTRNKLIPDIEGTVQANHGNVNEENKHIASTDDHSTISRKTDDVVDNIISYNDDVCVKSPIVHKKLSLRKSTQNKTKEIPTDLEKMLNGDIDNTREFIKDDQIDNITIDDQIKLDETKNPDIGDENQLERHNGDLSTDINIVNSNASTETKEPAESTEITNTQEDVKENQPKTEENVIVADDLNRVIINKDIECSSDTYEMSSFGRISPEVVSTIEKDLNEHNNEMNDANTSDRNVKTEETAVTKYDCVDETLIQSNNKDEIVQSIELNNETDQKITENSSEDAVIPVNNNEGSPDKSLITKVSLNEKELIESKLDDINNMKDINDDSDKEVTFNKIHYSPRTYTNRKKSFNEDIPTLAGNSSNDASEKCDLDNGSNASLDYDSDEDIVLSYSPLSALGDNDTRIGDVIQVGGPGSPVYTMDYGVEEDKRAKKNPTDSQHNMSVDRVDDEYGHLPPTPDIDNVKCVTKESKSLNGCIEDIHEKPYLEHVMVNNDSNKKEIKHMNTDVCKDISNIDLEIPIYGKVNDVTAMAHEETKKLQTKYSDPNFLSFVSLNQDSLIDENPAITENEIYAHLYDKWIYLSKPCIGLTELQNKEKIITNFIEAPTKPSKKSLKLNKTVHINEQNPSKSKIVDNNSNVELKINSRDAIESSVCNDNIEKNKTLRIKITDLNKDNKLTDNKQTDNLLGTKSEHMEDEMSSCLYESKSQKLKTDDVKVESSLITDKKSTKKKKKVINIISDSSDNDTDSDTLLKLNKGSEKKPRKRLRLKANNTISPNIKSNGLLSWLRIDKDKSSKEKSNKSPYKHVNSFNGDLKEAISNEELIMAAQVEVDKIEKAMDVEIFEANAEELRQPETRARKSAKSLYSDPEFLKFVELRQDSVLDEFPDLTEENIMEHLFQTWKYAENVNNVDLPQTTFIKGLDSEPSAPVKKANKKKSDLNVNRNHESDDEIREKPKRKAARAYYNEIDSFSDSDGLDDLDDNGRPIAYSKSKESGDNSDCIDEVYNDIEYFFHQMTQPKPNVFKGLLKEKVCDICEKTSNLVKCSSCAGMFHIDCVKNQANNTIVDQTLLRGRKKKKTKSKKHKNENDSEGNSEDRNGDLNKSIEEDDKMDDLNTIELGTNVEDIEVQLEAKMREMINPDELYDSQYTSEEELDWNSTVAGQCEIVDFKLKPKEMEKCYANFKCNDCQKNSTPLCFVCKSKVSPKSGVEIRQRCSVQHCSKHYHIDCLDHWPQTQINSGELTKHGKKSKQSLEVIICPRHVCHTCVCDDPRGCKTRFTSDKLAKCVRCPAVYHSFTKCLPAGSRVLSASYIICPRHYEHKPGKVPCHVNTGWCFICALGGTLICCEYCPMSFHAECLNIKPPEGGYMCEDCETGRLPLYGEMVWVKLGNYRWWPGLILHPSEIPDNVLALKHYLGEFVVRFFGQYDHYWVNRGRVFPFQEGDTGKISSQKNKIDAAFTRAIEDAKRGCEVMKSVVPNMEESLDIQSSLLAPHYIKLKVNKPCGSVINWKPDDSEANSLTQCECDPNDVEPCGPDSQCLNRMLLTECGPSCRAGDNCFNRNFEKRNYPKLVAHRTSYRGWGLKTLEAIKKGQFVIEYVGELIDEEEFRRRMTRKHEVRDENFYFLTLDKDRIIDAGPKGNLARFMNHSCEPNCETQKWTVLGDVRVGLFAIDDIPANTEVNFNYNFECAGFEKKQCMCGANRCSGYIGAKPKDDPKRVKMSDKQKRVYKKRKATESPTSTKVRRRPKTKRELSEIEKDLMIIKSASNNPEHDSEDSHGSEKPLNQGSERVQLKRKRANFSTEEDNESPLTKKSKVDE